MSVSVAVLLGGLASPATALTPNNPVPMGPGSFMSNLLSKQNVDQNLESPASSQEQVAETQTTAELESLTANSFPPAQGGDGFRSGSRSSASMEKRDVSDSVAIQWNPTNGNMLATGRLLNLRGVGQDLTIGWRYNSLNDERPTLNVGWAEAALRVGTDGSVTFVASDGGWYKFVPKTGGGWTMPPGLNASLTKPSASEYRIRFNDSGITNVYQSDGGTFTLRSSIDAVTPTPNTITYAYTSQKLTKITDTQGREVTFSYTSASDEPASITDTSLNRSIEFSHWGAGIDGPEGGIQTITDATGAVTSFGYPARQAGTIHSPMITSVSQSGSTTNLAYETSSNGANTRLTSMKYGFNSTFSIKYPGTGVPLTAMTDPRGNKTQYEITNNRVTKVINALGHASQTSFDVHDNVTSTTDKSGNVTSMTYNANNSITSITSPAGATGGAGGNQTFTYPSATGDPLSNYQATAVKNSEGYTTTQTYDGKTRAPFTTSTPDGLGGTPTNYYQGDDAGTNCGAKPGSLCRSLDGKGIETTYGYDAAGNPNRVTPPAPLGEITRTFDAAGRVLTVTDGRGETTTYTYDNNDRTTSTCTDRNCVTYTYDERGNLTQRVSNGGTDKTVYVYDDQNRLTKKTLDGRSWYASYDGASNLSAADGIKYGYDAANRQITQGDCPAPSALPDPQECIEYEYDNNDRRTVTRLPNGVVNKTTYDKAGRIIRIEAKNSAGAVLTSRDYTYTVSPTGTDGALRKTVKTETGALSTYTYDKLNQLTRDVTGSITQTWTYDKNGNRLTAAKTGTPTRYATYDNANQICWTATTTGTCATMPTGGTNYDHDANGNMTNKGAIGLSYNEMNQLQSSSGPAFADLYAYPGADNTERNRAGAYRQYNGILGLDTEEGLGQPTRDYTRDSTGAAIGGTEGYYTTDALGSVILITDMAQSITAKYVYDAWGNITSSSGSNHNANDLVFGGGYREYGTGLIKFGARYYDPTIGRFTQLDPSGQDPHYTYAMNSPCTYTDPSGLATAACLGMASLVGGLGLTAILFSGSLLATFYTGGWAAPAAIEAAGAFFGMIRAGIAAEEACNDE